jgi:hypothetical protein
MSNVCRGLDVEVLYDWNTGHDLYWGQVGHYTIGAKAWSWSAARDCGRSSSRTGRTCRSTSTRSCKGDYQTPNGHDLLPARGRPRPRLEEAPEERPGRPARGAEPLRRHGRGAIRRRSRTLLGLYRADPDSVDPKQWVAFYRDVGKTPSEMGLLPFRVAQL